MKVVIIDDEKPSLAELKYFLLKNNAEVIGAFTDSGAGFRFIERENPDAVFLDIDMPEINGIDLAIKIQEIRPGMAVIFVTAYPQYALEAYKAHPLDFIVKPIEEKRFTQTMQYLAENIATQVQRKPGSAQVICFGNFAVIGSVPVRFAYQKSRGLLTYLICNADQMVYRNKLIAALFGTEDTKKAANSLRVTLFRLRNTLTAAGIKKDDLYIREDFSIEVRDGVCDYIDACRFFRGNKIIDGRNVQAAERLIDLYKGEFLANLEYVWVKEKRRRVAVQMEELILKTAAYYLSRKRDKDAERLLLRLTEIAPLSKSGYPLLLDLYIQHEDFIQFELCYDLYKKVMEELGEAVGKKYVDFYETHCVD